ncbi:MAG: DUF6010 family protein [Cyclobacteriaceae bacterium]
MKELITGIVLATTIVWAARLAGFEKDRSFYPVLLIVIAFYYVLFSFQSYQIDQVLFEALIAFSFAAVALWGYHKSLFIVGVALILHGTYDLFHGFIPLSTTAPDWWPLFCLGVDVVLGIWLIYRVYRKQEHQNQMHQ